MTSPNHILAQEGIMVAFSIAKKVTLKDARRLKSRIKKDGANKMELNGLMHQALIDETQQAIEQKKVPGLLIPLGDNNEEKKRLMELTFLASLIAKKMAEKTTKKFYLCFIVNAIVNMLGLREEDFDEFHRKFSEFQQGESEE